MRYREFLPSVELTHVLDCIWTLAPAAADSAELDRVYPDGASDIVVSSGDTGVYGPARSFRLISAKAPTVGIRIRRGAARYVLGISSTELTTGPLSLGTLWGRRGKEFEGRLADLCASRLQVGSLCGLLAAHIPASRKLDYAVLTVIEHMDRGRVAAMNGLASGVGLSERQLRRRFEDHVGLGLKCYARVMRFQRILDAIRRYKRQFGVTPPDWAGFSSDHGLSDQAHLIREVKAFAGLTPAELLLGV